MGAAGRELDRCLEAAGIDRADTYLTNAVKHFKHERRGKRRLHKRPSIRSHLKKLYSRLGLHTRAEAIVWAHQSGELEPAGSREPTGQADAAA